MNRPSKMFWWLGAMSVAAVAVTWLLSGLSRWFLVDLTVMTTLASAGLLLMIGAVLALAWAMHISKSGLRVCYWMGAAPLVTGLAILLLIWLFEWKWLPMAGLYTLAAAGLLLLVGTILALAWAAHVASIVRIPRRPVFWPLVKVLAFYGIAAYTAMWSARAAVIALVRYDLTVHNKTSQPMGDVRATCDGIVVRLGLVDPGQAKRRLIWFPRRQGTVTLCGTHLGQSFTTVIDRVATCEGWRETTHVELGSDGVLRVRNRFDEFTEKKAVPIHPPATQPATRDP